MSNVVQGIDAPTLTELETELDWLLEDVVAEDCQGPGQSWTQSDWSTLRLTMPNIWMLDPNEATDQWLVRILKTTMIQLVVNMIKIFNGQKEINRCTISTPNDFIIFSI